MKRVEPIDHTADLGIQASADDLPGLFEAAAEGLLRTIADLDGVRPLVRREVRVAGVDLEDLLVAWLSELHYLQDAEGLLLAEARVTALDPDGGTLVGEARGEPLDADRHRVHTALKAITYHGLRIERAADGYRARVIFDV